MMNASVPKTICMARIGEILPNGDAEDAAAVDGTARADRYIGWREKFIMLARLDGRLPIIIHDNGRGWQWL